MDHALRMTAGRSYLQAPEIMKLNWGREDQFKKLFMSHSEESKRLQQIPWVRIILSELGTKCPSRKDELPFLETQEQTKTPSAFQPA